MNHARIKPIRYVKANGPDLSQETLVLLEILDLGRRQVEEGKTVPADAVFRRLSKRQARY